MPEWITSVSPELDAALPTLAIRLLLAWLCGWIVAMLARSKRPVGSDSLTLTLVLMSILISMATQIIGDNIARAFSLVGALSIVRFRTAVPATRDVAFVLAAVIVGMAIGAGQYWVTVVGLLTIALATQFNTPASDETESPANNSDTSNAWRLTIRVGLHAASGWESELAKLTESFQLISAETARRGGALELAYEYQPRKGIDAGMIVSDLNALPTVESASANRA